jgi:hypothetical protein
MLLKEKVSGDLIRILEVEKLWDPFERQVPGRNQTGEEEQPPVDYDKTELIFPSGEPLPQSWMDTGEVNAPSRRKD